MARSRERQLELDFKSWGGKRKGAGRKPKGAKAGMSHRTRAPLASRHPVHVTVRLVQGLPSMRRQRAKKVLMAAFKGGCDRDGFRLIHFSIQSNHLHLITEAKDRSALSRGMQGLQVRIARGLNRLWGRRGRVFSDRYQDHILRTPREVRNALCYVLHNAKKHRVRLKGLVDDFASGRWFDGWRGRVRGLTETPIAHARTWLLNKGWRYHGLIQPSEAPRAAPG